MASLSALMMFAALPWFGAAGPAGQGVSLDSTGPDARLRIQARVNGHAVALALDTGLDCGYLLFSSKLPPLGLPMPEPPPGRDFAPGKYPFILTQPCSWTLLGSTLHDVHPLVLTVPSRFLKEEPGLAGLVGWPAVRKNIWILNLAEGRIGGAKSVPAAAEHWARFRLKTDLRILSLVADAAPRRLPRILIDTGNADGIMLPPAEWRAWRAANPDLPATISADWMVGQGERAEEQVWAETFVLGDIVIHGVAVQEEDEAYTNMSPGEPVIALGLAALQRLDVVLDGLRQQAFIRASPAPPLPFQHNRLGADFLSADEGNAPQVATRAIPGTPAAAADIHPGDILVNVNGRPADQESYWKKPAGTPYALILKRGDFLVPVMVTLRNLIGPARPSIDDGGGIVAYRPRAIVLDRADEEFFLVDGLAKAGGGDSGAALADYAKAIAVNPAFAPAYCARAECREAEGGFADAIVDLNRAIALDPEYAEAYSDRGLAKDADGDFAGAIADCDRAIALDPRLPDAFSDRGAARAHEGKFAEALSDFDQALALNPKNPGFYDNRGASENCTGDFAGAIADYSRAIALNPQDAAAYRARGIARDATGDWIGALADYCNAAPSPDRNDLFLRFRISLVLRRLNMDEADRDLVEAVAVAEPGWSKAVGSYLTGNLSESDLLTEAEQGGYETLSDRECEADYYVAIMHLLAHDPTVARELLTRCVATQAATDEEYILARGELARLAKES